MPVDRIVVRKRSGQRPYKIVEIFEGREKVVGSSTSRANAEASARARRANVFGGGLRRRRRS